MSTRERDVLRRDSTAAAPELVEPGYERGGANALRSLEESIRAARELGATELLSPEFNARTDRALARADSILGSIDQGDQGDSGEELQAQAPEKSPGGLTRAQAKFLALSRARGNVHRPADELSGTERFLAGMGGGVAEGLTLGYRGAIPGSLDRETEALTNRPGFDAHDLGRLAGEFIGAMPLAIATGGLSQLGTRTLGRKLLPYVPRIGEQLIVLSRAADPIQAARSTRLLLNAGRAVWEGLAFTAASAPVYKLEEGQSRARQIEAQFGLGAAIDFTLGMILHVPGANPHRALGALSSSDNSIDRDIAEGVAAKLAAIDRGEFPNVDAARGVPEVDRLRASIAQGMEEGAVERGGRETAEELLRREVTQEDELRRGVRESMAPLPPRQVPPATEVPTERRLAPGAPPYEQPRFRGDEPAFELESRREGSNVQDVAAEQPPQIPAETGGPRLMPGEVGPEGRVEDVTVEKNRPFMSRRGEAPPEPAGPPSERVQRARRILGLEEEAAPELEAPTRAPAESEFQTIRTEKSLSEMSPDELVDVRTHLRQKKRAGMESTTPETMRAGTPEQIDADLRLVNDEIARRAGPRTVEGRGARPAPETRATPGEELAAPEPRERPGGISRAEEEQAARAGAGPEEAPELQAPKVRSPKVRDVVTAIEAAKTPAEVVTAASNLQGNNSKEAAAALEFAQAKLDRLQRSGNGAGGPQPQRPFVAEKPAPRPKEAPPPKAAPKPEPTAPPKERGYVTPEGPAGKPVGLLQGIGDEALATGMISDSQLDRAVRYVQGFVEQGPKGGMRPPMKILSEGEMPLARFLREKGLDKELDRLAIEARAQHEAAKSGGAPAPAGGELHRTKTAGEVPVPASEFRNRQILDEAKKKGTITPADAKKVGFELDAEGKIVDPYGTFPSGTRGAVSNAADNQLREPLTEQGRRRIREERRGRERGRTLPPQTQERRERTARRIKEQRRLARTDELTKLSNAQSFQRSRERLDADPNAELALIDLKNFKAVNDLEGHGAGDTLLRKVGAIIQEIANKYDLPISRVFRAGGDEFAVWARKGEAQAMARDIREAIGSRQIGESEFKTGARSGVGDTYAAADEAVKKVQAGEGSRAAYRTSRPAGMEEASADAIGQERRQPGTPDFVPEPDAEVPEIVRKAGFTKNPQPLAGAVDELGEDRIVRIEDAVEALDAAHADLETATEVLTGDYAKLGEKKVNAARKVAMDAQMRRDGALMTVEEQYGSEVADHLRARYGLAPRDLEPTLAEQASARRHADSAAQAYTPGQKLPGKEGASARVETPSGPLAARYRLVELDDLHASHKPDSWQADPDYFPEGSVQQRDYFKNKGNRASVEEIATKPQVRQFLDRSSFAQTGPPVTTPDGKSIAGNGRLMALKLMARRNPKGMEAYLQELKDAAEGFGFDARQIEDMNTPVLVRELEDGSLDFGNIDQMRELNIAFDQSVGKSKTSAEEAASRVSRLEARGKPAIEHLEETMDPEETLREYLWKPGGKEFIRLLREGDIITTAEANLLIDPKSGLLSEAGRNEVVRMLQALAVKDAAIVERAPSAVVGKIEHAVPGIIRSHGHEAWDISTTVREALELNAKLAEDPNYTGRSGKVVNFRGQQDLFGAGPTERTVDMAQVLEDWSKKDVTNAFRTYAREMDIATKQAESGDLFGFEPKTPEKVFDETFGTVKRLEAPSHKPTGGEPCPS